MFVSSYSTYINTLTTDKIKKQDLKKSDENKSFSSELNQSQQLLTPRTNFKIPINYISDYKSFANKQKLNQDPNITKEIEKFSKVNTLKNAKTSYEANSKIFSLLRVPHTTLNQVQKQEEKLPIKLQQKMVNTYIANDNYYKITA